MIRHADYTTPGSHNAPIPSREEFHRYTSEYLYLEDFCTDYPPEYGTHAQRIARAINWTIKNAKPKISRNWPTIKKEGAQS